VLSVPSGRSPSRESESSAIADNTFWNHYKQVKPKRNRQKSLCLLISIAYLCGDTLFSHVRNEPTLGSIAHGIDPESAYAIGKPISIGCTSSVDIERIKGIGAQTAKAIKAIPYTKKLKSGAAEAEYFSRQLLAIKGIGVKRQVLLQRHLLPPLSPYATSEESAACAENPYLPYQPIPIASMNTGVP
jgi:hypothetical protein